MEKFIEPCCKECFHSLETPCEQFVECCLSGPLCHESEECASKRKALVKKLAHSPGYLKYK